jgi:hypothetical protein
MHAAANASESKTYSASDLVSYETWLASIDVAPTTGWRWRKRGLINPINIFGRLYLSRQSIADFERRAAAGEFSKTHKTPKRKGADQ